MLIDKIENQNGKTAKAYLHFHPDVEVFLKGNIIETSLGNIHLEHTTGQIELEDYNYCLGFNKTIKSKRIIITFAGLLQTSIYVV